MYHVLPGYTRIEFVHGSQSDSLQANVVGPTQDTPEDVDEWLKAGGWTVAGKDYDNQLALYQNHQKTKGAGYFYWYEAIAYEHFWFMTVGGKPE